MMPWRSIGVALIAAFVWLNIWNSGPPDDDVLNIHLDDYKFRRAMMMLLSFFAFVTWCLVGH
jgi:hypothetical protein